MRFKIFLKNTCRELIKIDDSNQKIALSFSLGVFFGILPGAGLIISLIFALALRLNKAATLLGCLLTNTWIAFVTAIFAVKIGARIFGVEWQSLWLSFDNLVRNFSFSGVFKLGVIEILLPIMAGYLVIAAGAFLAAYSLSLFILKQAKRKSIWLIFLLLAAFSLGRNYSLASSTVVQIGNIKEFKPGNLKFIPKAKLFVISDKEGIYAVSAVCTHAGCLIGYKAKKLTCPCHGSVFDTSGAVLKGPAKNSLDWYALQIDKDGNLSVDTSAVIPTGTKLPHDQKSLEGEAG